MADVFLERGISKGILNGNPLFVLTIERTSESLTAIIVAVIRIIPKIRFFHRVPPRCRTGDIEGLDQIDTLHIFAVNPPLELVVHHFGAPHPYPSGRRVTPYIDAAYPR